MFETDAVIMIRHLIDDLSVTPTYSDERLVELIIVCAQFVKTEVILRQIYTIDVDSLTLTPDPTDPSNRDDDFVGLLILKAAAVLTASEARTSAGQSIIVKDIVGGMVDLKALAQSKLLLAKDFQSRYEKYKLDYMAGNSVGCKAILSPFRLNQPSLPYNPGNPYNSLY